LDVSRPNEFNQEGALEGVTNIEEAELMVVANTEGRILSVERVMASRPGFLMRNAGAIRWGGRALLVAGIGLSVYRIASAPEGHRGQVAAEEVGGQVFGAVGAAFGAAACVAFGVATAGVGLFLCGLAGGIALGAAGSAVGGHLFGNRNPEAGPGARPMTESEALAFAVALRGAEKRGVLCPNCHSAPANNLHGPAFQNLSLPAPGDSPLLPSHAPISDSDMELIREWLRGGAGARR